MLPLARREELVRRVGPWLLGALFTAALLLLCADLVAIARHKSFAIDEVGYAHIAFSIAHGQVPYRDFYEFHFPLNNQVLSLVFRFGRADPTAILDLRVVMLGWAALTLFGSWLLCKRYGALKALLGPLFLLFVVPLWFSALEVRNDPPGLALLLLGLGLRELPIAPKISSCLAGAACVACFWSTQKALMYAGAVFLPAMALDLWHRRSGEAALLLVHPRGWLTGAAVSASAIVIWLLATHNVGPFIHTCFVMAAHYQTAMPQISLLPMLAPQLESVAVLWPFAIAGVWASVRAITRPNAAPSAQRDVLLLVAFASTFGSLALSRAPYPYSAVPFWGLFGLFASRGVLELWQGQAPSSGSDAADAPRRFVLAAMPFFLVFELSRSHDLLQERLQTNNNLVQLQVLRQVGELTAPDDAFFDASGTFVARPHSYYYFVIDSLMRVEIPNLAREATRAIWQAQTVAVIPELRYGGLPAPLRSFIESHYQKYSGDLWLYGQSYDAASLRGPVTFNAIKDGRYFVNGSAPGLSIDGRPADAAGFSLTRGAHQIAFERATGAVQVLWLPKNGERWHPHPDARPTAFMTVF